jgi:hypothetical protein
MTRALIACAVLVVLIAAAVLSLDVGVASAGLSWCRGCN